MKKITFILLLGMVACQEATPTETTTTAEAEIADTTALVETVEIPEPPQPISKRIETEWTFEWLLQENEYEGKEPDCDIALKVDIMGQQDTIELWREIGFIEEFSSDDYTMVDLPENIITGLSHTVITQDEPLIFNLWYFDYKNDTVTTKQTIGQIRIEDDSTLFYDFDRPEGDIYYDYKEETPW